MNMHRIGWTCILFSLLAIFGCGGQPSDLKKISAAPAVQMKTPAYIVKPGDQLDIRFFYNPELNETVTVRPDGFISLQLIDDVKAAGLTVPQLDDLLTQRYEKELRKPSVTVIVKTFMGQSVYVGGEVRTPGLIELIHGMTVTQAVISAGGLLPTANEENAIVIRKGPDNRPIPIRVNLDEVLHGNMEETQLRPSDIVYIPKSFIANANQFVNQYIENLLLFRGVSLGFSYGINYNNTTR